MTISASPAAKQPAVRPRRGVDEIPAYLPGEASVEGIANVVKLSSNESALGASPKAIEAYARAAGALQLYPDANGVALREAIAGKFGLKADNIVLGAGSEELLHLIARAFVDTDDEVVVSQYGFIGHRIAALSCGAIPVIVPEDDYSVDLDAILAAVNARTKIVYVANPGNPTGTIVSFADLRAFHRALPPSVLLVIDSAYAEFAEGFGDYDSGIALVQSGATNILVTRTFSKMHGLAALRIGWAYGADDVVGYVNRVRPAFNANAVAQLAAIAALGDDDFVARVRIVNDQGLRQLTEGLRGLGLVTTDSLCNFVLVRFPGGSAQAVAAYDTLKRHGIIVRPVGGYGLPDWLRISVGLPADNARLLQVLGDFIESRAA